MHRWKVSGHRLQAIRGEHNELICEGNGRCNTTLRRGDDHFPIGTYTNATKLHAKHNYSIWITTALIMDFCEGYHVTLSTEQRYIPWHLDSVNQEGHGDFTMISQRTLQGAAIPSNKMCTYERVDLISWITEVGASP